ncbi:hypothetical protein Pla52o_23430 [Novipirellula galeiformis]|uniref:Uncharacterized protein n=1 Tax=Novipirellula galeiformis TaxID=2528004 RepID=A0A5C6CMU4_9BACT|nr:hypothetical protein Pla52o_23430 [Novipirellula galeiformis]
MKAAPRFTPACATRRQTLARPGATAASLRACSACIATPRGIDSYFTLLI